MQFSMTRIFQSLIILTCVALPTTQLKAITVSTTSFEGSAYNLIADNSGNLWLSLLATDAQSYAFVSSQIDNAVGDYADYRFATQAEVAALFEDYGAPDIDLGATDANFPAATAFQADFGSTGSISIGEPFTFGYTSTILVQGTNTFPNYHLSPYVQIQTAKAEATFRISLSVDVISDPNGHLRGSWLIRTTAPPPPVVPTLSAPSVLLLIALLSLIGGAVLKPRRGSQAPSGAHAHANRDST